MTCFRYIAWLAFAAGMIAIFPVMKTRGNNEKGNDNIRNVYQAGTMGTVKSTDRVAVGLVRGTSEQNRKTGVSTARASSLDGETRLYRVSAYCKNSCCCPGSADGITASGHRITNADYGRVVAAPKSIPFGTVLHIKGFGRDVVVEDRGSAIQDAGATVGGKLLREPRLDLLLKTHREAQEWGVKYLEVKVIQ
jgi:3D (Asp-Asp-Asp) domain-containing protein